MISILCPSNRIGGLDVLLAGLARQTLPRSEFELILIDDLHAFRAEQVAKLATEYSVKVRHLPPMGVPQLPCRMYEPGHYQRALNTGLAHARGSHVLVLCDYTMLADDCLERHVCYHQAERSGMRMCAMGVVDNVDIKPWLHPGLPSRYGWSAIGHHPVDNEGGVTAKSYEPWLSAGTRVRLSNEWLANYTADLAAGTLDRFMISVFDEPVRPDSDISRFRVWQRGRGDLAEGRNHHQQCFLKNDSFAVEDLLAVNGWDEGMDGCHGHQDSELAGRLEKQIGIEFWLFKDALATCFEPHAVAIIRGLRKPEHHNLGVYQWKWNSGEWTGGSELDLRRVREEMRNGI